MYLRSEIEDLLLKRELDKRMERRNFRIAAMMKAARQNRYSTFQLYKRNPVTGDKEPIPVLK